MDKNYNEVFSKKLKYYMDIKGLSQKELAQRIGVSEASVSNWQKGIKIPRADKVDKLCEILGCNRSDLVEESTIEVDSEMKRHLTAYYRLPSEWQGLISDLIEALQEEPQDADKIWAILGKISLFFRS